MLQTKTNPFSFAYYSARYQKSRLITCIGMGVFDATLLSFTGYAFKYFIDMLQTGIQSKIVFAVSICILIELVGNLSRYVRGNMGTKVWASMDQQALLDVTNYVSKHSYDYYANRLAGKVTADMLNLQQVNAMFMRTISVTLDFGIKLIVSLAIAFTLNYVIASFFILTMVVTVILSSKFLDKFKPMLKENERRYSVSKGIIADVIANFSLVKLFNLQKKETQNIFRSIDRHKEMDEKRKDYELKKISLLRTINKASTVIVTALVIYYYFNGQATLGDVALYFSLLSIIKVSTEVITDTFKDYSADYGRLAHGLETLLIKQDDLDPPNAVSLSNKKADIEFRNLNFSHASQSVLKNLNLKIAAGTKLGIVGPSGAGKSTLIQLLTAEYKVDPKQLYFAGIDASSIKLSEIRKLYSVVSQDTLVFNRSIKENLTLGKKCSGKQIQTALKKAHLWEFVQSLDDKLATQVGERGVKLSGGQRQRLGIARAILHNSPILLLDEATSSLDSKTEKDIQDALEALMRDKTVVAVAHRLSTLKNMDRIIVLKSGKIIEDGSHEELLKRKGLYFQLWSHQSNGTI